MRLPIADERVQPSREAAPVGACTVGVTVLMGYIPIPTGAVASPMRRSMQHPSIRLTAGGRWGHQYPSPSGAGVRGNRGSRRSLGWPRGDRRGHLPRRSRSASATGDFTKLSCKLGSASRCDVSGRASTAAAEANTSCYPGTGFATKARPREIATARCYGCMRYAPSPDLRRAAAAAGRTRERRCQSCGRHYRATLSIVEVISSFSDQN